MNTRQKGAGPVRAMPDCLANRFKNKITLTGKGLCGKFITEFFYMAYMAAEEGDQEESQWKMKNAPEILLSRL